MNDKKCICGLGMVATRRQPKLLVCPNCDIPQPREYEEDGERGYKDRIKTSWDHRFDLEWKRKLALLGM